jgi:queuine/archaeosine tRNA-ribosyltransferase
LGKNIIRLIVKLIEPCPRKLFTQAQAELLFSCEVKGIQSRDIVGKHDIAYNQAIEPEGYINIYKKKKKKKKGRRIPFHCKCAMPRVAD